MDYLGQSKVIYICHKGQLMVIPIKSLCSILEIFKMWDNKTCAIIYISMSLSIKMNYLELRFCRLCDYNMYFTIHIASMCWMIILYMMLTLTKRNHFVDVNNGFVGSSLFSLTCKTLV